MRMPYLVATVNPEATIVPENPASPTPSPYAVSPRLLQEGTELLRHLQTILGNMGRDDRRKSPEFQRIMNQYKALGAGLHEARKQIISEEGPLRTPTASPRSVTALGMAARAGKSPPPRIPISTGVSALGRAAQISGLGQAPQPATAVGPRSPVRAAAPLPVAAATAQAPAAPAPESSIPAAAPQSLLLASLPLPLAKFISTLGPAGSRAINKGPEVGRVQKLLAHVGYEVQVTQVYDVKTFRAVSEFQKIQRIPVSGLVGVETRRLLNEMVSG